MRIVQLGKRKYAFGLAWNDSFGDDAKEAVRDAMGEERNAYYTILRGPDHEEVLGFGSAQVKGSVYSYAAALASVGQDGLYVAQAGVDRVWYLLVTNGVVAAGTDRDLSEDHALDAIESLRAVYPNLPVRTHGVDLPGANEFSLEAIVAKAKVRPMRRLATENPIVGALVLTAVLGAVGFGGWYLFVREEPIVIDKAAELERKRQAYITSVQMAAGSIPRDAAWVVNAFDLARQAYPEGIAGWVLEGVSCTPQACKGTYAIARDAQGYALTPVWDAFGRDRVSLMGDKKSLEVALKLPTMEPLSYTEQDVMQPPMATGRIIDTIGVLGMKFGDVRIDGDFKTEQLNQINQAPPGTAPLIRDSFALRHDAALDDVRVKGLAAYLSEAQFVATTLNYSTGAGSIPTAWRIEWVRLHGGEQ